jgi:glycosyltransferase involved in cell wall biosynthesis
VRICYLCADPGISLTGTKGAAAHIRGLVGAFASLGHEVMVIGNQEDNANMLPVPVVPLPVPEMAGLFPIDSYRRVGRALRHVWSNTTITETLVKLWAYRHHDIVYERYSPFSVAGVLTAKRLGVPHVLEVNAPLAWEGTQYRQQAAADVAETLERVALESTSLVVAVSHELANLLVVDGVARSRIMIVPNGVNAALFEPEGPAYRIAPESSIVIGFVGGLRPWHGVDILADAFRVLASDGRFYLIVIGDGPMAKKMERLQAEFGERVRLAGAIPHEEIPSHLRGIDIAVAPYPQLEGFYFSPLKVLEYMAAGRAVIASGIGQLGKIIRHGENGILVPPGDAGALVQAVRMLADNVALRHMIGMNAASEVREWHTWEHRAAHILKRMSIFIKTAQVTVG